MQSDDESMFPVYEVLAQALLSHRADGLTVPTLMVATRTNEAQSSLRFSHAMALWGAAHAELVLEMSGDHLWEVGNPQRRGRKQVEDGWRTWVVYLEPDQEGADIELAMRALRDVVAVLGDVFGRNSAKESDLS